MRFQLLRALVEATRAVSLLPRPIPDIPPNALDLAFPLECLPLPEFGLRPRTTVRFTSKRMPQSQDRLGTCYKYADSKRWPSRSLPSFYTLWLCHSMRLHEVARVPI